MQQDSAPIKLIFVSIVVVVVFLPGCGRSPEDSTLAPTAVPTGAPVEPTARVRLQTLDPPQQNNEIGITLNALQPGLVITSNEGSWLEITDSSRLRVIYTFLALPVDPMEMSLSDAGEFEGLISSYSDGKVRSGGIIQTPFGEARWASGLYLEDDEELIDVRIFAPHPSGAGTLAVYSTSPQDLSSIEERLAIMQELLAHVS